MVFSLLLQQTHRGSTEKPSAQVFCKHLHRASVGSLLIFAYEKDLFVGNPFLSDFSSLISGLPTFRFVPMLTKVLKFSTH